METPPKVPGMFVRWNKAGWPVLSFGPETPPAPQKAEQVAAKQEWDAEGGAIKPSASPEAPKLPL